MSGSTPWWRRSLPLARRLFGIAFAVLVVGLVIVQARAVDWAEVARLISAFPARALIGAGVLALASYGVYGTFELLARRYTGHRLPAPSVLMVAFISYAFSLNLGALIGGAGLRFRLYTRLGLEPAVITRVWMFSVFTNWLGYTLIGGVLFVAGLVVPPAELGIEPGALRVVGVGFLIIGIGYLALCGLSRRRSWTFRQQTLELPGFSLALGQCLLSIGNWSLIAAVVFVLLRGQVAYPSVLGALMVSAVAASITHVPGAVGILETVFIALLGERLAKNELLAALLVYRAVYYLIPLVIAGCLYLAMELRAKEAGVTAGGLAAR
ncbi:MAG: hypothetical protein JWQ11_4832 [Rhizobacter sp.]|nr:hypothetical protein [Rhizobacter sp.]